MATERIISGESVSAEEARANWALRPERIGQFVGQRELIERLRIGLEAANGRDEPMDHVLLHGPPGLGKTTLAHVIAHEMGANLVATSGPALTRGTDLVGALTRLGRRDVLFIDEIHRLPTAVEEFIYPAMEDHRIDVQVDSGMHARTVSIALKPFTLIGATTRAGLLSSPLRSRFGVAHNLRYYEAEDLLSILTRSCAMLSIEGFEAPALALIASRSRGTPRVANRLLRRVRDYAQVRAQGKLSVTVVEEALALEGVDTLGLDELDRRYLRTIGGTYRCGPVGLEAIAATMGEDAGALEAVVEPFLLQVGFLARTRRGRQLTADGARHVGVAAPAVEVVVGADGERAAT
ncbi:MAG: Holliday junction branch migration DNA helicase RuvB [Phycisphaeraceae bacterium]|nr:Holliday junction branch migration DNA helicase RuvB [Phycisphaeraceae bacterium]